MPAHGPCPSCGGQLVQLDRSGVHIDACRNCRGVWLDRGELDAILARERQVVSSHHDDDEEFFREMTGHGHGGQQSKHHHSSYGFDVKTAEKLLGDFRSHSKHKKKHKKSFLDELFD